VARQRTLHFYLAGINNENFLMRDRQTGSWWQQVTGRAISGPLEGETLELVANDELSFGLWKAEAPRGLVLEPVAGHEKDYDSDWEKEVEKLPVTVSFPGQGLKDRDVVLGLEAEGQARAFPLERVQAQSPMQDKINGIPILLVVGPDGKSVRIFRSVLNGAEVELYRDQQSSQWQLVDGRGNIWNFQGCAVSGPAAGQCLKQINYLKDYWFDWRNYHPQTTISGRLRN
jgi:uncharacterized protein DUF3179